MTLKLRLEVGRVMAEEVLMETPMPLLRPNVDIHGWSGK
jgi:hypothetical protein